MIVRLSFRPLLPASHHAILAALLLGCQSTTVVTIETDPMGADVSIGQIGHIGTTPLTRTFSSKEVGQLKSGDNISLDLVIGKRGYIPIRINPYAVQRGTKHTIKKSLEKRLEEVTFGSDPPGAAVFTLRLDEIALLEDQGMKGTVEAAFHDDPRAAEELYPRFIVSAHLGTTPCKYEYDPEDALEHNDPILFRMPGFRDTIVYFKVNEEHHHAVLTPIKERAR